MSEGLRGDNFTHTFLYNFLYGIDMMKEREWYVMLPNIVISVSNVYIVMIMA
jgi:hypothetical protein